MTITMLEETDKITIYFDGKNKENNKQIVRWQLYSLCDLIRKIDKSSEEAEK